LFEQVKLLLERDPQAYLIFDDTVLDKSFGPKIEVLRKQWSGNKKGVIRGVGVVSCVYVNPQTQRFWVIDYRIFDPDTNGKSKLDHVEEMLRGTANIVGCRFGRCSDGHLVRHEGADALDRPDGKDILLSATKQPSGRRQRGRTPLPRRVEELDWSERELRQGKRIKIKGFPKDYKVKLFRVVATSKRTEWVVTNDLSGDSTQDTREVRAVRWRLEEFHREAKQLTGG
jgi:hypothetical protein